MEKWRIEDKENFLIFHRISFFFFFNSFYHLDITFFIFTYDRSNENNSKKTTLVRIMTTTMTIYEKDIRTIMITITKLLKLITVLTRKAAVMIPFSFNCNNTNNKHTRKDYDKMKMK